jgi:hypothetical protein
MVETMRSGDDGFTLPNISVRRIRRLLGRFFLVNRLFEAGEGSQQMDHVRLKAEVLGDFVVGLRHAGLIGKLTGSFFLISPLGL